MRGPLVAAFGAGVLVGGIVCWLLVGPGEGPQGRAFRGDSKPLLPPPQANRAAPGEGGVPPARAAAPDPRIPELEAKVAGLEASLADARKEARRNLLRGALVLTVQGRTPEDVLRPLQDIPPDRGVERFHQRPEMVVNFPWMYLSTMVEEDFEEALARTLDRELRWTEDLDLDAEESAEIRGYVERAYRLMDAVQRRQATLRRRAEEGSGLSPEERESARARLLQYESLDRDIHDAAQVPWRSIPSLFPRRGAR